MSQEQGNDTELALITSMMTFPRLMSMIQQDHVDIVDLQAWTSVSTLDVVVDTRWPGLFLYVTSMGKRRIMSELCQHGIVRRERHNNHEYHQEDKDMFTELRGWGCVVLILDSAHCNTVFGINIVR
jgi:hypothetical protein